MANGARAGIAIGALTMLVSAGFWIADRSEKKRGCGARYQHLVVTATGQTLQDPYGWIPTFNEYNEWKALAEQLTALALTHYDDLGRVECERTGGTNCGGDPDDVVGGSYPRWNALVDQKNMLVAHEDDLPSEWTNFDIIGGITRARSVIQEALCLLDRADQGLEFYKAQPPPIPGIQHAKAPTPWYVWTGLAGAGVTAGSIIVGAFVQEPKPSGGTTIVVRGDDDDVIDVDATER